MTQADTPSLVSLQPAADYDPGRVLAAMRACLEPLGGMGAFVRPGQRVLLKPNLVGAFPGRTRGNNPSRPRAGGHPSGAGSRRTRARGRQSRHEHFWNTRGASLRAGADARGNRRGVGGLQRPA